jgi:hypothetical protein
MTFKKFTTGMVRSSTATALEEQQQRFVRILPTVRPHASDEHRRALNSFASASLIVLLGFAPQIGQVVVGSEVATADPVRPDRNIVLAHEQVVLHLGDDALVNPGVLAIAETSPCWRDGTPHGARLLSHRSQ